MKKTLPISKFLCRLLLLIACCTTANQAFSQYQSFFGEEKTTYHIYSWMTCYMGNDELYSIGGCSLTFPYTIFKEDTLVLNDATYYISQCFGDRLLIREDTVSGKLFRYIEELNREFLICDMSLSVGDTFTLPIFVDENGNAPNDFYYHEEGKKIIVDSITYMNGKKVIHLSRTGNFSYSIFEYGYFNFIEGIGPVYGPFGYIKVSLESNLGLLLCVDKDDTLSYMMSSQLGCYVSESQVEKEPEINPIRLFPNPTSDQIQIEFDEMFPTNGLIRIFDPIGHVVYSKTRSSLKEIIPVSHLFPGVYMLQYTTSDHKVYQSKFIKIQ